jgi:2-desacetyl-2-hydroxyethyl bacteriochlorophyllide A dehydrogenase
VDVVDVEVDEPGDDEVLVRTLYSGISSGSELLAYRGEIDPELALDDTIGSLGGTFSYPFRYGYSCVGIVESSAGGLVAGSRVFAFHPHQQRFVCPVRDTVPVPEVDPRVATLFPHVETAFQVALEAGELYGEPVVVMGLGSVGVLSALLLRRRGACVIAVEPSAVRRGLAQNLGITCVPPEGAVDAVETFAGDVGVPVVVEASGNPRALASALGMLAREGTVLVVSWYGTRPVTLPLGGDFHRRRLTIRSTQVSTIPARLGGRWDVSRRRKHVAGLLPELPLEKLTTHEYPFARAPDAYAALDRGDEAVMHVALAYEGD